jgi:hypothetical protein
MSELVRISNRGHFRRPLLWGGLAIFLGALLALMSWLNVFDALGSTAVAQVGSAVLTFLGIGIIFYALVRHVLWVEFGQQIRVGRALRERLIEWSDVASVALEEERVDVRPLEPLANLPRALGVPGVGTVARLTGVTDKALASAGPRSYSGNAPVVKQSMLVRTRHECRGGPYVVRLGNAR